MSNILLPGDPDFDKPIVMGDAYKADPKKDLYDQVLPPGVKRAALEKQRAEEPGAFKYAATQIAYAPDPWFKNAQLSGVDNMMAQPMWFSPLHTPQNWQIASKRREVYQWNRFWYENEPKVAAAIDFYCFAPETQILMASGSQKSISSIEPGDLVRSHDGTVNQVIRTFARKTDEQMLNISIAGISLGQSLRVTKGHELLTKKNGEIKFVQAQLLKEGDYLLTPVEYSDSIGDKMVDPDFAWLLGLYAAEGCGIPYEHTSQDGHYSSYYKGVYLTFNSEEDILVEKTISAIHRLYGDNKVTVRKIEEDGIQRVAAYGKDIADDLVGLCPGMAKDGTKRFAPIVMKFGNEDLLCLLAGFLDGDGCFNKNNGFQGVGVSKSLSEQIANICDKLGIEYSFTSTRISKDNRQTCYNVRISRRACSRLEGLTYKIHDNCVDESKIRNTPYCKEGKYIFRKIRSIKEQKYTGIVHDLEIENSHSYVANRISCHNSRFPMNGFKLECPDRKILSFFEHHVVKKLKLNERFKEISSEYYTLGDVFIHTDIECPICFPADTMITTENGHKPIQSIQVGENVLCFNGDYHQVERTVSRKYAGNMIDFKISHLPNLVCTELHPIYSVKGFYYEYDGRKMVSKKLTNFDNIQKVEAKNLDTGDYVVVPIYDKYNAYDQIMFDQSEYYLKNKSSRPSFTLNIDHDLAKLFAWYVGEGSTDSNRTVTFSLNGLEEHDIADWIIETCERLFGISLSKGNHYKSSQLNVSGYNRALSAWMDELCGHGSANKHVPFFIFHSSNEIKNTFIDNLQFADGHARKERKEKSITTISKTLAYDVVRLLHGVGQSPFVTETPDRTDANGVHHRHAYCVCWTPDKTKEGKGSVRTEKYQFYRILDIRRFTDETTVYNITVENQHNYVAGGICVKNCGGTAIDPDTQEECDHPGGKFSRVFVMNPDWIEVQRSPLTDEPLIVMIPDEELQQIVHKRQPKAIYDRIPEHLKPLIMAKAPIPLSNRTISHLRHMPVPYGTYGTSIIRRLFTTLAYKTKIMTANWIVAERLILPVRVVKIGSDDRPATTTDIADVQQQLAQTANDPNLTIVTHHNFDYEWYGTSGKVLQITQEMEHIDKELLDGLMLNQALLNGEAPGYMCHDEETEVLTDNGFKKIDLIHEDDEIMCFDNTSSCIRFESPQALHIYDYDGELIHFHGNQLDIMVTPNHKMLVRSQGNSDWKTVRAENVKPGMRFLAHSEYEHNYEIGDKIYVGETILIDTEKYFEYVGYYLSEGHMSCQKSNYQISISQSKKTQVLQAMVSCVDNLGMKYTEYDYDDRPTNSLTICNKEFVKHMKENFGSHAENKSIPSWMKNTSTSCLSILLMAMVDGDGQKIVHQNTENYVYTTISEDLANDVQEIAFKCGYNVRKVIHVDTSKDINSKSRLLYRVKFSKGKWSKGNEPRLKKQHISKVPYKGKVWCFSTSTGFFVTRRNGKMTIQGNSAQVGVETLIRRIEAWRTSLAEWCEDNIFKPIAEMQGFVDEEKSEEVGETVFLYPTIKWNDLELKDNTQYYQMLMQLHDKQVISSQTLLEEMDLNYDQEVKRMRHEQAQLGPAGAALGQGMGQGGMGGGGGMPGGAASPEQGGLGMPGMGMDMGGGMGGMGGMGGGMDGGMGGGMGGGMAAGTTGKITKKGKGGGDEEEQMIPTMPIKLTKIEQDMAGMLEELAATMGFNPGEFKMQFPVDNPKGGKSFTMDFALPSLKIDIEADGEVWHSSQEQTSNDTERDYLLAQRGWTILRFDDKSIEDSPQQVQSTIDSYIRKAMEVGSSKQASKNGKDIHGVTAYFVGVDGRVKDFKSDGIKYYKYLDRVYSSRIPTFVGQRFN